MTVYVDNAGPDYAGCPCASWWSHLWADTVAELDDIAARLGLSPVMRHDPTAAAEALPANDATPDRPHYEVTDHERTRAILFGACTVPAAVVDSACQAEEMPVPGPSGLDAGDLNCWCTRVRQQPSQYIYPFVRVLRERAATGMEAVR